MVLSSLLVSFPQGNSRISYGSFGFTCLLLEFEKEEYRTVSSTKLPQTRHSPTKLSFSVSRFPVSPFRISIPQADEAFVRVQGRRVDHLSAVVCRAFKPNVSPFRDILRYF